jgi:hypothetical protein
MLTYGQIKIYKNNLELASVVNQGVVWKRISGDNLCSDLGVTLLSPNPSKFPIIPTREGGLLDLEQKYKIQ